MDNLVARDLGLDDTFVVRSSDGSEYFQVLSVWLDIDNMMQFRF